MNQKRSKSRPATSRQSQRNANTSQLDTTPKNYQKKQNVHVEQLPQEPTRNVNHNKDLSGLVSF